VGFRRIITKVDKGKRKDKKATGPTEEWKKSRK
jgi:hypothetical protein